MGARIRAVILPKEIHSTYYQGSDFSPVTGDVKKDTLVFIPVLDCAVMQYLLPVLTLTSSVVLQVCGTCLQTAAMSH